MSKDNTQRYEIVDKTEARSILPGTGVQGERASGSCIFLITKGKIFFLGYHPQISTHQKIIFKPQSGGLVAQFASQRVGPQPSGPPLYCQRHVCGCLSEVVSPSAEGKGSEGWRQALQHRGEVPAGGCPPWSACCLQGSLVRGSSTPAKLKDTDYEDIVLSWGPHSPQVSQGNTLPLLDRSRTTDIL